MKYFKLSPLFVLFLLLLPLVRGEVSHPSLITNNLNNQMSSDSLDSDVGIMIYPKAQDKIMSIGCFEDTNSYDHGFRAYTLHNIHHPIVSNRGAFATYSDTSLLSWGSFMSAGNYIYEFSLYGQKESITPYTPIPINYSSSVVKIVPTLHAFASLLADGYLGIRGFFSIYDCRDDIYWDMSQKLDGEGRERKPIVDLTSNDDAFLGVLQDGSLIGWRNPEFGGDGFISLTPGAKVTSLAHTPSALIALLENNTLFTWGKWTMVSEEFTGNTFFEKGISYLFNQKVPKYTVVNDPGTTLTLPSGKNLQQIQEIIGIKNGIVLLFQDGSLAWWKVGTMQQSFTMIPLGPRRKARSIVKLNYGILVLLDDQTVLYLNESDIVNVNEPFPEQIRIPHQYGKPLKITSIASNDQSIAAILSNGKVVCWGESFTGGITPTLPKKTSLSSLVGYETGFMGLLNSGELLLWGSYVKQNESETFFERLLPPPKNKKVSFITSTRLYPVVFYDDGTCAFFDTQSTLFIKNSQPIYSVNYLEQVGHLLTPEEVSSPAYQRKNFF